jgi:preprotein translocase subunit SecD
MGMSGSWWWRTFLIVVVVAYSIYYLIPSWVYFRLPPDQRNDTALLDSKIPRWAPKRHLNLGLDLQGGIELVMGVDADKAMRDKAARRADDLKRIAQEKKLPFAEIKSVIGQPEVEIVGHSPAEAKAIADMAIEQYGDSFRQIGGSGNSQLLGFQELWVQKQRDDTVEQAVKSLRNRVDKWGVSEAEIKRLRGSNGVQIQLPGFKDPERAKKLLGGTAQLELKMVDDEDRSLEKVTDLPPEVHQGHNGQVPYLCSQDRQILEKFAATKAPEGDEFGVEKVEKVEQGEKNAACQIPYYRTITLKSKVELTGDQLTDARVQLDNQQGIQRPVVGFTLDKEGADKFAELTEKSIGKRMAIVLDGIVESAPVIQSKIPNGSGQITIGGLKPPQEIYQDASDLALVLKAGALPAPVRILEERTVGASLGPELIQKGTYGALAGLLIVWLFMVIYYRVSGLVADFALAINGLLLLAAMAMFGSTLTLPGIAGTVLTLGMAVDANVLINERIREELRGGKSPRGAVDAGYNKVFWTIVDGHVTAFVAGAVLYYTGTGPVKGFAVTLMIGLAASMFTSIVVTRQIIDLLVRTSRTPRTLAAQAIEAH